MINRVIIGVLGILILISFATLPFNSLQTDDAAMYALTIKNMVQGQGLSAWLMPQITPGDPQSFLDKPPLGLWLLAIFPKVFGVNEWTVHVGNVCFYILVLVALWFFVKRFSNRDVALGTVLIAATALALLVYSRSPKMEILLTLFVVLAHASLGLFLQQEKRRYLFGFFIFLALGFLVKSGLVVILPMASLLLIALTNTHNRQTLLGLLRSRFLYMAAMVCGLIVLAVLGIQALAFKSLWFEYLKSFTLTSKYNVGYLGLGVYPAIVAFALLAIFPWTPLALTQLKIKNKPNLQSFCASWFWGSFLFFLFFYRQVDARTVVVLVPPMAILAGIQLQKLSKKYSWISWGSLGVTVVMLVAYSTLFLNTRTLVDAANPQNTWPKIIREYRSQGKAFYIYRPHNRPLFMSNDLAWLDFQLGADKYFWDSEKLLSMKGSYILLTDPSSFQKLKLPNPRVVLRDAQAVVILR